MDAVLGTAGHIDHGKTSLVRALTGINCDRLDEEQRRGITIELGFAWLDLPDKRRLGIVDVPGHERFVKNMVAGAAGIDCVLLVIAADEGVMPQTREHLDICAMLGIERGLVALTKSDMVDAEWLQMVCEDTRAFLSGTFLQDAPIIPVSSSTGEGVDELRAAIAHLVASLKPRQGTDILRLPIDRVFSLKGFGTVVTGTVVSGECRQGETLCVANVQKLARARSLQVHSVPVETAHQGQRCAINLQNVEVADIPRGDVISAQGALFPALRWFVRLTCLKSAPAPVRQRAEAHFYHLARECAARIVFFDRNELAPGESAIAELRFDQTMAGIFGDHFVIRSHSPLRAIAGGIVLDPLPPILRQRDPLFEHKFGLYTRLASMDHSALWQRPAHAPEELAELALALRQLPGADEKQLAVLTGLKQPVLAEVLGKLGEKGAALNWDAAGGQWAGRAAVDYALEKFAVRAAELHEREPLKAFFAPNALFAALDNDLPQKFLQKALEEGVRRGLFVMESNGARLASWQVNPDPEQSGLIARIMAVYKGAGLAPPWLKDLQEQLGKDAKCLLPVLAHLCDTGVLLKIQEGLYYPKPVFDDILERIRDWFASHDTLDAAGMKSMFELSRKYTLPLMEYLDSIRVTSREGDKRVLRK